MPDAPFRYDWGETVRITTGAPSPLVPGSLVSVVGMTEISQPREILGGRARRGQIAYLIEFEDGSSVEVPEQFIEPEGTRDAQQPPERDK